MSAELESNGYSKDTVLQLRQKYLNPSMTVHYSDYNPLNIVKGEGVYLIDETGQPYLDCINNVALVGHSHPRLVEALQKQMTNPESQISNDGRVMCNDRLWYDYTSALLKTAPEGQFDTILFVRSGSEANDTAISIAEAATEHSQIIALDGSYHGHTSATVGLSTYKERQAMPGGFKHHPCGVILPKPDIFQGQYKDPATAGSLYARDIKTTIDNEHTEGRKIAAFISEPFMGTAGQVPLPDGYLKAVYKFVHEAGGLCISDEVQTGFGRAGKTFWMYQIHDVCPDMVIIGKPMANGHPISGVMAKWKYVSKFFEKNGHHLMSQYISDPLSLSLAETVLNIIYDEKLQENAQLMGEYIMQRLIELKSKYSCIGDVRGTGLFIGMEIIKYEDGIQKSDGTKAKLLVKRALLDHHVLIKEDGVDHNVIKIKPPLCFNKENANNLIDAIDQSLAVIHSADQYQ